MNVIMDGRAGESLVFMFLLFQQVICEITGPSQLTYFVGDNAHFRWNNTNNNSMILSATWGIKKDNIADPKFISVDILSSKVFISLDLEPDLMNRVSFDGDLKKGRAWFTLKNVTVNDTNEYLASISDDEKLPVSYTVVLTVKERERKDEQNEVGDITTKEPDTNQVVISRFSQMVNTATKETQLNVVEDPVEPTNFLSKNYIILIVVPSVLVVLMVLTISAMMINYKKKKKKEKTRDNASREKMLIPLKKKY